MPVRPRKIIAHSISHNVKKQVVQKCAISVVKELRKLSPSICSKTSFIEHLTQKTSKKQAATDNTCNAVIHYSLKMHFRFFLKLLRFLRNHKKVFWRFVFIENIYIYIKVINRLLRMKSGFRAKIILSFDPNKLPEGYWENLSKELNLKEKLPQSELILKLKDYKFFFRKSGLRTE